MTLSSARKSDSSSTHQRKYKIFTRLMQVRTIFRTKTSINRIFAVRISNHLSFPVLEKINLLTVILRSGESPSLNRVQMQRVMRAHHAHAAYVRERNQLEDSDDDDGPKDDEAWLYEDLLILAKLYAQLRDREQLIELIFEVR